MDSSKSRRMIAALQISLDGYTQGEDQGEDTWVDSWADAIQLVPDVDAFVQGAGMYPGYGDYWSAIEANPKAIPPYSDRAPTKSEVAYAQLAARSPHYVVSRKLERVSWPPTARIVRDLTELRTIKGQPGKNMYVVGGPTLVVSLLNEGLLDELRLIVHPILLGGGKALFAGLEKRHVLQLVEAKTNRSGSLIVTYRTGPVPSGRPRSRRGAFRSAAERNGLRLRG